MKYLGVDFGLKRVGLAISEGELASPWKILDVRNLKDAINQVIVVVKKGGFDKVVVGLPEGKTGQKVHGFINSLRKKGLEVESADETLSSKVASARMVQLNISKKKRRLNDDMAAAIILQQFIDEKV